MLKLGKIVWFYRCYEGERKRASVECVIQVQSWESSERVSVSAFGVSFPCNAL